VILGVLLDEGAVDGQRARVLSLSRRSVAGKAGIKEGDRIVSLGGQEVKDPESLRAALARVRPGESVPVRVRRGEQSLEMKAEFPAPPGPVFGVAWDDGARGGKGALVREVAPGSVAEKAGVKPGDRILSFGGKEVPDAASLPAVLRTATPGAKVKVTVLRDGKEVELEAAFP
jgi:S1-C subfamily serine protease